MKDQHETQILRATWLGWSSNSLCAGWIITFQLTADFSPMIKAGVKITVLKQTVVAIMDIHQGSPVAVCIAWNRLSVPTYRGLLVENRSKLSTVFMKVEFSRLHTVKKRIGTQWLRYQECLSNSAWYSSYYYWKLKPRPSIWLNLKSKRLLLNDENKLHAVGFTCILFSTSCYIFSTSGNHSNFKILIQLFRSKSLNKSLKNKI